MRIRVSAVVPGVAATLAVCSLVACGSNPPPSERPDSGFDSGVRDSGVHRDGGDAGAPDSGFDAGEDATVLDSGGDTNDAASDSSDAGDAGVDATLADAGPDASDAGVDVGATDAAEAGPSCIDMCSLGGGACTSGGSPEACERMDSGCTAWVPLSACGTHQACQSDGGPASCACVPSSLCAEAGPVCDPTVDRLDVCDVDSNGCLYLNPGSYCVTDAGNAAATCSATQCVVGCVTGFHSCNSVCSSSTSANSCGSSCTPCTYPANAAGACDAGSCDYACNWGWGKDAGGCSPLPAPPRPLAPLSSRIVTTSSPTLSWQLPSAFTQAHVDVCSDRACANVLWSSDVTGTSAKVGLALPRGAAFWRVFGLVNGQRTLPSVTWQFHVPGRNLSARPSSWGTVHDFNGDGLADLVGPSAAGATVYFGSDAGITDATVLANFPGPDVYAAGSAGDVNGDGFADLVVATFTDHDQVNVYFGGPTGLPQTPSQVLPLATQLVPVGDVNSDGYADLAVSGATPGTIDVYFGSPTGLSLSANLTLNPTPPGCGNMGVGPTYGTEQLFGGGGDVNGDGYDDVVAGDGTCDGGVGILYVFFGGDAGLATLPSQTISAPTAAITQFGAIAVVAGDLNGDGYADVGLGAPPGGGTASDSSRNAYVFYGSDGGLPRLPSLTLGSPSSSILFNTALAAAGDINGDGYTDFIVGDPQYFDIANPNSQYGAAFIYFGGPSGIPGTPSAMLPTPPPLNVSADSARPVAGVGDTNGDGWFDVVSSCWGPTGPGCAATLYFGSDAGVNPTPAAALPVKMNIPNGATWWSSL